MVDLPTAETIAAEAHAVGLSLVDMCARAGVAYTTFYRWRKGGAGPSIDIVKKLLAEINQAR